MKEFDGVPLRWREGTEDLDKEIENTVPFAGLYEKTCSKNGKQIRYLEGDVVRMGNDALQVVILPIAIEPDGDGEEIAGTLYEIAEAEKAELLEFVIDQLTEGSDDEDAGLG